jgi:hypothetical protein
VNPVYAKRWFVLVLPALGVGFGCLPISEASEKGSGTSQAAPSGCGCCSHHGGVCGCSGGRALCCDNTLRPTCGC